MAITTAAISTIIMSVLGKLGIFATTWLATSLALGIVGAGVGGIGVGS